jgi:alpha-tubulin suppressor-like RCC1 family protein
MQLVRGSPLGEAGCGIDGAGSISCWGYAVEDFAAVPTPGLRFTDVAVGQAHRCALEAGGTVYCWGYAPLTGIAPEDTAIKTCGTIPSESFPCVKSPSPITSPERFQAITAGQYYTCGLTTGGKAYCWGEGYGGLGLGEAIDVSQVPAPVATSDLFSSISAGYESTCAVSMAKKLDCWGVGYSATGFASYIPVPVPVPGDVPMQSVSLHDGNACGLDTAGQAWCWGGLSRPPVQVLGRLTFSSIGAGDGHACAVASDGAWCWGANGLGQLGNGGTTYSPIPVRVANQDQFD